MQTIGKFTAKLNDTLDYKYVIDVDKSLEELDLEKISSGEEKISGKSSFIIKWKNHKAAVSIWVSAKRTRSYPYTRMYETMSKKDLIKITIIPVVKDEGIRGCNDHIQWDTFSLCSYLGLYVIPGYHVKAIEKVKKGKKIEGKVDNFEFDISYIVKKTKEIFQTKYSPKEWNDNERNNIGILEIPTINGHIKIEKETGVKLHDIKLIKKRFSIINNPENFKKLSQKYSELAQKRESKTKQPKEQAFNFPKAELTCYDKDDGKYSWTADGYQIEGNKVFLIEMKHAKGRNPPSLDSVEDAFFKFHFFANIKELRDQKSREFIPIPTIVLSSAGLSGACFTACPSFEHEHEIGSKCVEHKCDEEILKSINMPHELIQKDNDIQRIFREGIKNNILIIAIGTKDYKKGLLSDMLKKLSSRS